MTKLLLAEEGSERHRDVVQVQFNEGEAWVFDYGVLILWGVVEEKKISLIKSLQELVEDPLEKAEYERYRFIIGAPEHRIHQDLVSLAGDSALDRLAVSHAFAQSIKLAVFEEKAQQVIEENAYVPRALAKNGKAPLNRKSLARQRGILFSTKSDIVLNFNLLDTPEFFWDYPELEALYLLVSRYLDVIPRVNLLSKKLETIHELLDMLASEQNHKHSSFLEWIIIILIAVEIVMALIEKAI
ncbi:RMD1 family protein [Aurantivibrio infirmus]